MSPAAACPSCRQPMEIHRFTAHTGQPLELDICYACQGLWIDQNENLKLPAQAVVELFGLLHRHRSDERRPLQSAMACPRCTRSLAQGFDVVRSGRYMTYRCASRHGRFSTFASFMVEKGFVRQLNRAEIAELAEKVKTIHCNNCGATVDLRKDHACPFCRAAFSLLDPQAVEKALARYGSRAAQPPADVAAEVILASERIQRENRKAQQERRMEDWISEGELWSAGLAIVWKLLRVLLK